MEQPQGAFSCANGNSRIWKDIELLERHHSRPFFSRARKVLRRDQMSWRKQSQTSWNYWPAKQKSANARDGKPRKDAKDKKSAFPGYDAAAGGSASSSSSGLQEEEFTAKKVLQALMKNNSLEMPEEYKTFLTEPMGEVKEQQKYLNAKRKAIQRVERLKQAKLTKVRKWDSFKIEMARHLRQEQERYDKDMQEIEAAIAAAMKEAERIEQGLPEEPKDEDLESLLEDNGDADTKRQLQEAREEGKRNQEMIQQLQRQLQAYMQQENNPAGPNPGVNLGLMDSPQQIIKPKTPEEIAKEKNERRARIDRVEKMEQQLKEKDRERERSPRRDSQESLD